MAQFRNGGAAFTRAAILFFGSLACIFGAAAVFHPDTPLPDGWNPIKPLDVDDSYTAFTDWKLSKALSDPTMCRAALAQIATFQSTGTKAHENPNCGIENTVVVDQILGVNLGALETDCRTALRTAMWIRYELAPASERTFPLIFLYHWCRMTLSLHQRAQNACDIWDNIPETQFKWGADLWAREMNGSRSTLKI